MPSKLPDHLSSAIAQLLALGEPPKAVAEALKCSVKTVYRLRQDIETFGTPYKPVMRKLGRPTTLSREQELVSLSVKALQPISAALNR